jgi:hypothetical protein
MGRKHAGLPENKRARKRRVTAKPDLYGWSHPAQRKPAFDGMQKRCFRKVHLPRNELHPSCLRGMFEETNSRWIAPKRGVGKGIYNVEQLAHNVTTF